MRNTETTIKGNASLPNARPTALTAAAGAYFVASRLAFEGFHAAITFGNAPTVDVLVSSADGAATVALQVKTTAFAVRTRGRGDAKQPHHYEWDVGYRSAHMPAREDLIYAFVDLRGFTDVPDIFLVPSTFVANWCSETKRWFEAEGKEWKRYRMHISVGDFAAFRNDWELLRQRLSVTPDSP